MAEPQRDLTPEQAAQRLRACPEVHYLDAETNTTPVLPENTPSQDADVITS